MRVCSNCGHIFEPDVFEESNSLDPIEELVTIFQQSIDAPANSDICHSCCKELGFLSISGFSQ